MLEMLLDKKLLFVLMGDADRTWSGRQVYREYDDETYDRGGGKYEQKQSSVDAPGPGEIRTCMYDQ